METNAKSEKERKWSAKDTIAGGAVMLSWGYWYTDTHKMEGFAAMLGQRDPVYVVASWAMILGVLTFLTGLGLLIASGGKQKQRSLRTKKVQSSAGLHVDQLSKGGV